MNEQQIYQLQKHFKFLQLSLSLDQSQILNYLFQQNDQSYLSIECSFSDADKQNQVTKQLGVLTHLIGLDFQFYYGISTLPQTLSSLKNLTYLFIRFRCSTNPQFKDEAIEFGKSLSTLENLQLLSLTIQDASYIDFDGAKAISKSVKNMNKLTNLQYSLFLNNKFYDTDIIIELLTCFKYTNILKFLQLTINTKSNLGDSGLYEISNHIKNLINLETFILNIQGRNGISENGIKNLQNSISSLIKIQKIRIEIVQNFLYKKPIIELIESILESESLVELEMILYDDHSIMKNHFTSNKKQRLYKNKNLQGNNLLKVNTTLKKFSLHIEAYDLNQKNQYLERRIGNWIHSCQNLFEFKCNVNIILEKEIQNLEKNSFLFPKQLQQLQFSLKNVDSMDDCENFFQKIQNVTELEKLDINVDFSRFTESMKQSIVNWFQNLKSLKNLYIKQADQFLYSRYVITNFVESLQCLKQLTRLTLLSFIPKHDKDLLQKSFSQLKNLKYVNLRESSHLDKETGDSLLKAILNLENLNELLLNYFQDQFKNNLRVLDKLRKLNLFDSYQFRFDIKTYWIQYMSSKYPRLVEIVR